MESSCRSASRRWIHCADPLVALSCNGQQKIAIAFQIICGLKYGPQLYLYYDTRLDFRLTQGFQLSLHSVFLDLFLTIFFPRNAKLAQLFFFKNCCNFFSFWSLFSLDIKIIGCKKRFCQFFESFQRRSRLRLHRLLPNGHFRHFYLKQVSI